MPVTFQTQQLHEGGAMWIATIRSIHQQELKREPTDGEIAAHVAWVLEERDGGWDDKKMRASVQGLEEWKNQRIPKPVDPVPVILVVPVIPTPPDPPAVRRGVVRAEGRVFADDTGRFRPFGGTLFWALYGWKNEQQRVKDNLAWLANHGVQYVRILGQVGWPTETIDPAWPDYVPLLSNFLDTAYNTYGLRTEITCVGGGGTFSSTDLATRVVAAVKGREHTVMHLEVANEYFATFNNNEPEMRKMADILRQLPLLLAPSSPGGGNEIELSRLMQTGPYTMATVHKQRDNGDHDWRFVRQNWDYKDKPWPVSNNEPKGPFASVSHSEDPLRLAMDRAVGILCGVGAYVLHNANGIFGRPNDHASGGHRSANVWELDNADAIYDGVAHVDSLIPDGVENWTNSNDHWTPPNPVHPLPVPPEQFWEIGRGDHGVNKNYAAIDGGRFVCMPCGVLNFVEMRARQPCEIKVFHPVTRKLVVQRRLSAGETVRLEGDANANTAFIVVGQA
jgi:hypothetical protein